MNTNTTNSRVQLKDFNAAAGLDRGASKIKEMVWYLIKVGFFLSALPYPSALKRKLLQWFGAQVGSGVIIKPRVNIHFPWKLTIGNDVWIGEDVFILNFEPVVIESNVCISQRAFLCGGNHDYKDPTMPYRNGPIYLEAGCWIGAGVFVGPEVRIGQDTVVTVGSVVTKNLPPNRVCHITTAAFEKQRWTSN